MSIEDTTQIAVPKPKRRVTKRKPILGMLPRFILVAAISALTLSVCFAFAAKIAQPYEMIMQQGSQIRESQGQLQTLQRSNQELSMRRDYLKRPEGIEVAARSAGYLRKGETRLVLESAPQPLPEKTEEPDLIDRFKSAWLTIFGR